MSITLRNFDQLDWECYAGANDIAPGQPPQIAEGSDDYIVILSGQDGVTVVQVFVRQDPGEFTETPPEDHMFERDFDAYAAALEVIREAPEGATREAITSWLVARDFERIL